MQYEWGPWIEHDGSPNPVGKETIVTVQFRKPPGYGVPIYGNPECDRASAWIWWHNGDDDDIIRYRVRKPRVSEWLQDVTENIDGGLRMPWVELRVSDKVIKVHELLVLPNLEPNINGTEIVTYRKMPIDASSGINVLLKVFDSNKVTSCSCLICGPTISTYGYYKYSVSVNSQPETVGV